VAAGGGRLALSPSETILSARVRGLELRQADCAEDAMRAMVLTRARRGHVESLEIEKPAPGPSDVLVKVLACGVCRTDLHVIDGELPNTAIPIVPGHEIVGRVEAVGRDVTTHAPGDRVGIPWLGWSCGVCEFCSAERENLCPNARFVGYQLNGGYAEYAVADASYCFSLPEQYGDSHAAPLLCAGLIGYRAYRMAGQGLRMGVYGFGAAAHIITQVALHQGREIYAFAAPGDHQALHFSRDVGATWAGFSNEPPPRSLDSAIIFAPVGPLVPEALSRILPGGVVVCAGIHMSDIPSFPYRLLWEERTIRSVANLTQPERAACA
jgi:propanol-preferring alcohol dehydrogenase